MATYKHITDLLKICSVLPALAIMPAMAETVTEPTEGWGGKHYYVTNGNTLNLGKSDVNSVDGTYANWYHAVAGGVVQNYLGSVVVEDETIFSNNASYIRTEEQDANLSGSAGSEMGGAIYAQGNSTEYATTEIGNNVEFNGNIASAGGAIFLYGGNIVNFGDNVKFSGNKGTWNLPEDSFDSSATGDGYGGAIASTKADVQEDPNKLGPDNGNAILTFKGKSTFEDNVADRQGGAISLYGSQATFNGDALFTGNTALAPSERNVKGGGAISATDSEFVFNEGAAFANNSATGYGGAIWNGVYEGSSSMTFNGSASFENNSANNGGAIYNDGNMKFAGNAQFIGNSADNTGGSTFGGAVYNKGDLEIEGATFSENRAENQGYGGAIFNASGGLLNVNNSVFEGNSAEWDGGAISSTTSYLNPKSLPADWDLGEWSVENVRKYWEKKNGFDAANKMVITNSTFSNNTVDSYSGGALGVYSDAVIDNTKFVGNDAGGHNPADSVDGGGAIYAGGWARVDLSNSEFTGNSSNYGGAIATTRAGLEDDTRLHITNSKFAENKATVSGGAISNKFQDAVINNSVFTGNTADVSGGAIYNEAVAKMEFAGNNVFAGNTAAGVANDIYNEGILNIASGTTTLGGGITGDGTLTIADGATLNIGTTTVKQSEVTLDGTLTAQILNQGSYGRVETGNITVGDNGLLNLMFGSVGTYNFGVTVPEDKIVYNNAIYDATFGETGEITVATKSVEEIAQGTNLSMGAANAVSIMANTKDDVLNTISLMAQQDLVAGKTGNAEKELAKLNPDDKPVAQSVASSVQNQVMSLAAGRMSGASVGRSGGDLTSADYGLWVQGLYNHSKYNGKFSGDTWGISVGADTLIDGKYTLGIGYAYNDTDVDSNSRDTGIESNSLFLYGQYKPNEWYVNAALNYTMANYDESADPYGFKRKTEYDVDSFGGQIMTGYDFASGFTPEVGMRYLHISQDAYQSWLGEVDALDTDYLTGVAGVKYAFEIESASELKFRPELRAAATYDFMSDAAVATVTAPGNVAYVIDADRLSRFGGEFGIGLTAQYRGLDVSLNYELDLHEDYTSQTGMLKFRYDF